MLNVVYDPFLTRKSPFLLCSYFNAHPTNTTSQNIGGTDTPQIWGDRPPGPLGLRPWLLSMSRKYASSVDEVCQSHQILFLLLHLLYLILQSCSEIQRLELLQLIFKGR